MVNWVIGTWFTSLGTKYWVSKVTLTPVVAPADHGEGRGREVELGPGEAGDAAKWDGTQVHLARKVSPIPEYLIRFILPSNRFSLKVPFHRRVEAW